MINYKKYILSSILLLITACSYSQWVQLNTGTTQNLYSINFTDFQTGFACGAGGTIIKTTNGGVNWSVQNSGLTTDLRSVQMLNASLGFACGASGKIITTTNGGTNWAALNSGVTDLLYGIYFSNNLSGVCAGNSGTTLYTTNSGVNWIVGQPTGYLVTFYSAFMVNSSTGFCGGVNTIFSSLFAKTTNGGANWVYSSFYVNNNEATIRDLYFFNDQNGYAVTVLWNGQGGISKTTNGGQNWSHQVFTYGLTGIDFPGLLTGYTSGSNGNVNKTTDGGTSWLAQVTGINNILYGLDFIDSLTGFVCGETGTIIKTTNGGVVPVNSISNAVPFSFELFQNYPNPFNPVTKIKFSIPSVGNGRDRSVRIIVYDALGREVQTLINEHLQPGTYEVEFEGTNFSSGIYYYTLTSGNYRETKSMVLFK